MDNVSVLRADRVFEKCIELGYNKWRWVHKKLKVKVRRLPLRSSADLETDRIVASVYL